MKREEIADLMAFVVVAEERSFTRAHFFKRPVWFTAIDHGAANQRL